MFATYGDPTRGHSNFNGTLGKNSSKIHPLIAKANSLASHFSDVTKELDLLSSPEKSPYYYPTESNPENESEKSILFQQINEIRVENDELEKKLTEIRRKKAEIINMKYTFEERVENMNDGMEAVLDYLLQTKKTFNVLSATSLTMEELGNSTQLENFAIFTKILFSEISHQLISEPGALIRQYSLAGSSYDLPFRLKFNVDESDFAICHLDAKVLGNIYKETHAFLESVQKKKNIHAFFKGFVQYARLNHQRKALFQHLSKLYPKLVTIEQETSGEDFVIDGISSLRFRQGHSNVELLFVWDLQIRHNGHVQSNVQLLPRVEKTWKSLDKNGIFDALPEQFLRLVELKGLRMAVEIMLACIFEKDS